MKTIRLLNKILFSIILLGPALFAGLAGAHTSGFTYEAAINNYFVDIGASKLEIVQNELTLFEFNLYPNTDPNNLADFDNVYVTVGDESAVHLSTFVHRPQDMLTVLSYSFPKAGKYQISARFQKGTVELVEVSFPVEVGQGSGAGENTIKIAIFAAIILAAGVAVLIMRRKSHRAQQSSIDK